MANVVKHTVQTHRMCFFSQLVLFFFFVLDFFLCAAATQMQVLRDGSGVVIRGLGTDKAQWIDSLLEVLLVMANWVEEKQKLIKEQDRNDAGAALKRMEKRIK